MVTRVSRVLCRASLNYVTGVRDVAIRDGRRAGLPGWEDCGFQLLAHRSVVDDWHDADAIAARHYPEMRALAQELTGADHVLLSNHISRNPQQARLHGDLGPITLVHCDFADSYGPQLVARYRDPDPAEARALAAAGITGDEVAAATRLLILQFWRNVGPAKMDLPLAWCDARTVPRSQIRPFPVTNYAGGGLDFEALGFVAPDDPDEHGWYGFDRMQVDEVVAFRTYDSDMVASGASYWTPHSAYRDPEVPLGDPSRSSIELRAICLFV